jgi:hypothetical protein
VARTTRSTRRSRRPRLGLFETILGGATDIVGSVAKEVAPEVVGVLDVDGVIQEIDIQAVLDRVDLNSLLDRVDLDELLGRLDVNALVERLDLNQIVAKVDMNALLENVDVDALVERTEIGSIIARSGAGVAGKVLDVARSQGVGLDFFVHRWMDRLLRRRPSPRPGGPALLVGFAKPSAT